MSKSRILNYNLDSFKRYLINTYTKNIIKYSEFNPNKNNQLLINTKLINNISDNKFNTFIKKSETIPIENFIKFLLEESNTNNTKGKYHELMDMINSLYDISVQNELPDYSKLNTETKNLIFPKRIEYLISWWIIYKIKNDKFLNKYLYLDNNKLTYPSFQKIISETDDRYYDIVFENLDIIVEIQEDNSAHLNNFNDTLKESLVKIRSKRIVYFKINDYNSYNYKYLSDFWNNLLKPMLLQSCLNYSSVIRQDYCIYSFRLNMLNEYNKISKDLNNNINIKNKNLSSPYFKKMIKRQEYLKPFIMTTDKSLILLIFSWKEKSHNSDNKYVISTDEIFNIVNYSTIDEFDNFITNNCDHIINENRVYIKWNTLITILIMDENFDYVDKLRILDYITNIQDIYEDIIDKIKIHNEDRLKITINMQNLVETHIINKQKEYYEPYINQYKQKNDTITHELNLVYKKMNNCSNKIKTLVKLISSKAKNKRETELLNVIDTELKQLDDMYKSYKENEITIQKIVNSSIIKEIKEFPIVFTNNSDDYMEYSEFEAICNNYGLTKKQIKNILSNLIPNNNCIPMVVPLIINNNNNKNKNKINYFEPLNEDDLDDCYNLQNLTINKINNLMELDNKLLSNDYLINEDPLDDDLLDGNPLDGELSIDELSDGDL